METTKSNNPQKPQIDNNQVLPRNGPDIEAQNALQNHDYSKRAQWLRAAVLGANDGLLSTASLMMGIGAVRQDPKTMILTGIAARHSLVSVSPFNLSSFPGFIGNLRK